MGNPTRILILGGGFGGTYTALGLERLLARRDDVQVTLVARDNYFLFTPMLHEVAASDLDLTNIVNPLQKMLDRVDTFVGTIEAIDVQAKHVRVAHGLTRHTHELPYDHLVLALGSTSTFFNLPGVGQSALTMRSLTDAIALRNRIIMHLEEANSECAAGQCRLLLTFVVAGAGFAGVETMAGINDFVREALPYFQNLRQEHVRMVLISPDELILPELSEKLGRYAQRKLASRGVEIINNARVTGFENGIVSLNDGRTIPTDTLIWTAGTAPTPLLADLPLAKERGRLKVNQHLEVEDAPGVWALGDCALVPDGKGGFHPPTAQHALRQAKTLAHNISVSIAGGRKRTFRFSTLGQLAAIGHRTGVANIFGINFSGFFAWWLWRTIYLSKLPRMEKKVRVALDWTLDVFFTKDFVCFENGGKR